MSLPFISDILKITSKINFADSSAAVSAAGEASVRYNHSQLRLESSINGNAWAAISGAGGGTLLTTYTAGASQTDSTMTIDGTRLGIIIKDRASPLGSALFRIESNDGTSNMFSVSNAGISMGRAPIPTSDFALSFGSSTFRWVNVYTQIVDSGSSTDLILRAGSQNRAFITPSSSNSLISGMADGASAVGTILDTASAWSNGTAKLLSVRNNNVEKVAIFANGDTRVPNGWLLSDAGGSTSLMMSTATGAQLSWGSAYFFAGATARFTDGTGTISIGATGAGNATATVFQFAPDGDNSRKLGTSTLRWSEAWAQVHAGVHQDLLTGGAVAVDTQLGEMCVLTSNANVTGITLAAGKHSQIFTLEMVQGNVAHSWPTTFTNGRIAGGTFTKTGAGGAVDTITFRYNSTNATWDEISRVMALA